MGIWQISNTQELKINLKSVEFKEVEKIKRNEDSLQSEILNLLERHDIRLDPDRKDQHILISEESITQLIDSAELTKEDTVLEIGPGTGQVTKLIAEKADKIYTIETDRRFKPILEDLQNRYNNLEVIFGSALDVKWPIVNKLVSSPPYSILESLIERLVMEKKIKSCSLVIGEKYYQRCASSKDKTTRTSLMTQAFFDVELISKIKGDKFFPQSRDESVIMKLLRKDKKKADFGLRLLVSRMINTPNESVINLIRDIIKIGAYAVPILYIINKIPICYIEKRRGEPLLVIRILNWANYMSSITGLSSINSQGSSVFLK
jgi:16S rRNA (adenine1518-N6/adenine1519-N6)-dimethyltransferase